MAESYGASQASASGDKLFAGELPHPEKPVTILSGSGALTRGRVLGKITKGTASSAAKSGGNTGNGTLTMDVTTPILAGAIAGVYQFRITSAAYAAAMTPAVALPARGQLVDPNGVVLAECEVPTTPGTTVSNKIKFAVLEGNTPFIKGDGFDITIAAGSGKHAAYDDTAVTGKEIAVAILGRDVDATSADVKAFAYVGGEFNTDALTGLDAAGQADLEAKGFIFRDVVG